MGVVVTDIKGRQFVMDEVTFSSGDVLISNNNPLDKYVICDKDNLGAEYEGYANQSGAWYIVKIENASYRYASGSSGYTTNWTNRLNLTYTYIFNITVY